LHVFVSTSRSVTYIQGVFVSMLACSSLLRTLLGSLGPNVLMVASLAIWTGIVFVFPHRSLFANSTESRFFLHDSPLVTPHSHRFFHTPFSVPAARLPQSACECVNTVSYSQSQGVVLGFFSLSCIDERACSVKHSLVFFRQEASS
jgi:hypothetical protein